MGQRTKEVKAIIKQARKEGWEIEYGEHHDHLIRDGVKIPFSMNPGSDAAIKALKQRIRKNKNDH